MAKDYYETLGVDRSARKEDIKRAYKRLAKKYHPDLNKSDPALADKFKEINEAAAVLGDDQKRAQYDQFGSAEGFQGGDFSGFDFADFMQGGFDFGDIFDRFFNRGFGFDEGRGAQRGHNLRFDLEITLEESAEGITKQIVIPKLEECSHCSGTGAEKASDIETCSVCKGSGTERQTRRTPFGIFATTTTCRNCEGTGQVIKNPCLECKGQGRLEVKKRLKVNIPAGVEEGMRLRVAGEGEAGQRGSGSGDLFVVIHIKPHKILERAGNDLFMEMPITFAQAALGDEIEVPTLKGKSTLKIPPGTQPDTVFRMRGKGIPNLQGFGTGSQNVKITVQVPTRLSAKQKELLKQFEKTGKKKGIFF